MGAHGPFTVWCNQTQTLGGGHILSCSEAYRATAGHFKGIAIIGSGRIIAYYSKKAAGDSHSCKCEGCIAGTAAWSTDWRLGEAGPKGGEFLFVDQLHPSFFTTYILQKRIWNLDDLIYNR